MFRDHQKEEFLGINNVDTARFRAAASLTVTRHKVEVFWPIPYPSTEGWEWFEAACKQRGARLGTRRSKHKFDGYTESWPTTSLKLESLQQLLEWIRTDEDATSSS